MPSAQSSLDSSIIGLIFMFSTYKDDTYGQYIMERDSQRISINKSNLYSNSLHTHTEHFQLVSNPSVIKELSFSR